jgi:hypothetical protein
LIRCVVNQLTNASMLAGFTTAASWPRPIGLPAAPMPMNSVPYLPCLRHGAYFGPHPPHMLVTRSLARMMSRCPARLGASSLHVSQCSPAAHPRSRLGLRRDRRCGQGMQTRRVLPKAVSCSESTMSEHRSCRDADRWSIMDGGFSRRRFPRAQVPRTDAVRAPQPRPPRARLDP